MVPKGKWGGSNEMFGINRYKLLYIRQIDNKGVLCGPGNQAQHLRMTYNAEESVEEYMYMDNHHFDVPLKLTQHCKSTVFQVLKAEIKKTNKHYRSHLLPLRT